MITAAAAATSANQPPGLFLVAWGLIASVIGLLTVTNIRGFAENFARQAQAQSSRRRRRPPWKRELPPDLEGEPLPDLADKTRQMRFIAIPFAIVGPIVTVVGLFSIARAGIGGFGPGGGLGPFGYLFIVFAVAAVGRSWLSPRGFFRSAARRGGWRLAVALLSSLGGLIFGIGIAMGQSTIAIAAWVIGGLPSMLLVMEDKAAGPESLG